jgi:ribosomal protein L19
MKYIKMFEEENKINVGDYIEIDLYDKYKHDVMLVVGIVPLTYSTRDTVNQYEGLILPSKNEVFVTDANIVKKLTKYEADLILKMNKYNL